VAVFWVKDFNNLIPIESKSRGSAIL